MRCRLFALSSAVAFGLSVMPAIAAAQRVSSPRCVGYSYGCDWSDRMADRAFDRAERSRERAEERAARAQDRVDERRARLEARTFVGRTDDARREEREMRVRERANRQRERVSRVRRMRLDW